MVVRERTDWLMRSLLAAFGLNCSPSVDTNEVPLRRCTGVGSGVGPSQLAVLHMKNSKKFYLKHKFYMATFWDFGKLLARCT